MDATNKAPVLIHNAIAEYFRRRGVSAFGTV